MNLTEGIHEGIPMDQYLLDPVIEPSLSATVCNALIAQSPYHAAFEHPRIINTLGLDYARDNDANDASNIGSIAHALLLEGDDSKLFVINPENFPGKPKRKGEEGPIPKGWGNPSIRAARDEAQAQGFYPILRERERDVRRMASIAADFIERTELRGMLGKGRGRPELTMVWRDTQYGNTWCRARPDWLTMDNGVMLHFKTTAGSAQPQQWIRSQLTNMGYDITYAFYARGHSALTGSLGVRSLDQHAFFVQEQTAPYCCSLVSLNPEFEEFAERKMIRAVREWAACQAANRWPAYDTRIHYAEPLPWQQTAFEEAEANRSYDELQAREGLQP